MSIQGMPFLMALLFVKYAVRTRMARVLLHCVKKKKRFMESWPPAGVCDRYARRVRGFWLGQHPVHGVSLAAAYRTHQGV